MITFEKIKWRNLLSTGNAWTEVDLNRSTTTLIVGKNGEGKSTILDALMFSLYGRPFRKVKKDQLVNSINGKNLEVEIEFTTHGKHYKVLRGAKPNKLEIWSDGIKLDSFASNADTQTYLQTQIIGFEWRTFSKMVILGSASYLPFMQMGQWHRRQVIEDILEIRIFRTMNELLTDRMKLTKESLVAAENAITIAKKDVDAQKELLDQLSNVKEEAVEKINEKLRVNEETINNTTAQVEQLMKDVDYLNTQISDSGTVNNDIEKVKQMMAGFNNKKAGINKDIQFFEDNEICPQCEQSIEECHKNDIVTKLRDKLGKTMNDYDTISQALEKLNKRYDEIASINQTIMSKNTEVSALNQSLSLLGKTNKDLVEEQSNLNIDDDNVVNQKAKLKDLAKLAVDALEEKTSIEEQKQIEDVSKTLLADTGIKTEIIHQYLPIINKLINKYLQAMDFFVHFELDEDFNETIRSRYRDEFTYDSFSEGEKLRIDLAILFTWRQIAKMKNSVNTNLLLLDEIFDSSMDTSGTDLFLQVLNEIGEGTNVFVISHKGDQLFDKFRSVLKFVKKNDFSSIQLGA